MKIIGITGGIGSGKSQVLTYLEKTYGAACCQADQVAKRLQKKGTKCYRRIVDHFGEGILDGEGRLDRDALGNIVFSNKAQLRILNEIVHPAVKEKIREIIRKEEKKGTSVFVLEAALFIEENYNAMCDEVWYIYADEAVRRRRLKAERGYSDEKIDGILANQLTEKEYERRCGCRIENNEDLEYTYAQIRERIRYI